MSTPSIPREAKDLIDAAVKAAFEKAQAWAVATVDAALAKSPGWRSLPRLLTVQQTMAYLNCSRAALYRWEKTGELVPTRRGRKVLYEIPVLDAFTARAAEGRR